MGSVFQTLRKNRRKPTLNMKYFILLFSSLVLFGTLQAKKPESNREEKLFSLFTIVNFKNDPCRSTDTSSSSNSEYRNGTCYTSSECTDKGGSPKGKCAAGFGICCVFTLRGDDSTQEVNNNDTYIQNPGFPTVYTDSSGLSYTVNKCKDDICWIRLDFDKFELSKQTSEISNIDSFTITESEQIYNYPILAGTNTGQHIYIELGSSTTATANLKFEFDKANNDRNWDIKVSQFTCYDRNTPYQGCLQWFTGLTGTITTFNYGGIHLPNQNYRACVRQEQDYCCVKYSVCSDTNANGFNLDQGFIANAMAPAGTLGQMKDANGNNIPETGALIGTYCTTNNIGTGGLSDVESTYTGDFITIAGSASTCSRTDQANGYQNYCGTKLNTGAGHKQSIDICDCAPLFGIRVHTDAVADYGSGANTIQAPTNTISGVCLDFTHVPCNQL